jgi:hypothetical protein
LRKARRADDEIGIERADDDDTGHEVILLHSQSVCAALDWLRFWLMCDLFADVRERPLRANAFARFS